MKSELLSCDSITRRAFAEHVAKAALGVTILPDALRAAGTTGTDNTKLPGFGKAKRVIWMQMEGGMSHIDTLDPKEGDTKGPKDGIKTKAGVVHFALREVVRRAKMKELLELQGKVDWEGDLNAMRETRTF